MYQYSHDGLRTRIYGNRCIYCGEISQSDEHFPPRSMTNYGWIFPCCLECNALAGIKYHDSFDARFKYVKEKLKRKYSEYYYFPDWTPAEIEELNGWLKEEVIQCQKAKEYIAKRIAWNAVSYLASIGLDINSVLPDVELPETESESELSSLMPRQELPISRPRLPEPEPKPKFQLSKNKVDREFERNVIAMYGMDEGLKIIAETPRVGSK